MGGILGGMIIFIIATFWSMDGLYFFCWEQKFDIYIPDNFNATSFHSMLVGEHGSGDAVMADNKTFNLYGGGVKRLEGYRGEYVTVTARWSNSDDESGYMRWISDIEIQNGTRLGDYPNGIWTSTGWYREGHPNEKYTFWNQFGGLISIIVGCWLFIFIAGLITKIKIFEPIWKNKGA
jgi:hypothetical protein